MNFYFVFEGKTEPIIYKKWFSILLPKLSEVKSYDEVTKNNYHYQSDMGIPNCYNIVADAIQEINEFPEYDYLVLFLDADALSIDEKREEANEFIQKILDKTENEYEYKNLPSNCKFHIIVQKVCIETWFLGNRKFFPRQPHNELLKEYINYYDIFKNDPEKLASEFIEDDENQNRIFGYATKALFHESYLREIFKERLKGQAYRKSRPKYVQEEDYLLQLLKRIKEEPSHLKSFQEFIEFCKEVKPKL